MSLAKFLSTFNNVKGSNVYSIDPLNFFAVDITYSEGSSVKHTDLIGDTELGLFIQSIELPTLTVTADTAAETIVGTIQTHKMYITPSDQTFRMSIINTKHPLIENWIYPWMREVTYPEWQYKNYPYTKGEMTIDFTEHTNIKYVLNGIRPTSISPIRPTQEVDQKMTREVTFTFDYMYVLCSKEANTGSNIFRSIFQKAAKTVGL